MSAVTDPDAVARELIERATAAGVTIAAAESLTGGALVARLVDVPGASACVAGGAVCYSLRAKHRVLGVDADLLERGGAVTAPVAAAMAQGALELYESDLAISTTGVAGPGPDERGVGAGTVLLALARRGGPVAVEARHADGDRPQVRAEAVAAALRMLGSALAGR